ncbi:hypothetical protein M501DRAFT_928798, partial [Patellaria atrata CBS 101060]
MFIKVSRQLEKAEEDAYSIVEPDSDRFIPNTWLDRSGWAKHFAGFDRTWLRSLVQRPGRHESALTKLCWAVESVIYKAQRSSTAEVMGLPSMNYINRREAGNDTNEKPLNTRQAGSTMIRYSRVWVGMIGYIWRTYKLEAGLPAAGNGVVEEDGEEGSGHERTKRRPTYRLTGKQQECLSGIIDIVREDKDEEDEAQLESNTLAFLLSLLDHQLKDSEYQSALISATA